MPQITAHAPNTPFWVDLASPDLSASTTFYGHLFGWGAQQVAGPEMGSYTNFTLSGHNVAGLSALMAPGQPTAWTVYISTDNLDRVAESVQGAGGAVMMEPADVPGAGRLAYFSDPAGAAFGVLQPREHGGAQLVREPNTLTWAELQARDAAAVAPFYEQVFGWGAKSTPMGPGLPAYTEWTLDGESIGGAMPMQAQTPAEMPSFWMPYFQVEHVDQAAATVADLGGTVHVAPRDFPGGRFAVVADPHGATFGLLEARS